MYLGRMKESYHLCFTSHDEVMFRDAEDHGMFLNILALRGFALETEVECEAEMSTHVHMNAFTAQPGRFAGQVRMSYPCFTSCLSWPITRLESRIFSPQGKDGIPLTS